MFTGSIVALVTPMDEKGAIDRVSLRKLIDYHVASGTKAIVSVGTTGETSTLTHEEHGDMVMWTLELSDGRVPVIAGTGANSTAEAVSLTRRFNDSGVVGCLSVTPYYNRPSQEGLYQHFKAIAESSNLPQILYNVPTRTGCDMLPPTVARLAEINNIIGLKEATGNLSRVSQIQDLLNTDFLLLSGDDASALDFMQLGGQGVISVTANIAAKEMAHLCALAAEGNYTDARRLNQRLMPLHKTLFFEPSPIPVKWACKVLELIKTDTLRLPMMPLTETGICVVKQALIDAGLL
ncbi:4-hydroxy-tetrahydrodipicolinate synthase [Candidatus Steffania adelgidicola]|uniref:4-hydroxy-tetrahydrodipicolinate synthase n=1 Tax=Candidatus Steffania adelgidicola TaxID=1076626 RepID=UPI001D018192|nr:4-hydroxy-tetrahydrodipicolinate synthase [Candidatus Steffania adelgidicola]UDG80048.1 4-hydroxy-tetrahydrodipicolinate synthase [Candidatus Steffania adelgidicola]